MDFVCLYLFVCLFGITTAITLQSYYNFILVLKYTFILAGKGKKMLIYLALQQLTFLLLIAPLTQAPGRSISNYEHPIQKSATALNKTNCLFKLFILCCYDEGM